MNNKLLKQMAERQEAENKRIQNLDCYEEITNEFKLEYQIAKTLQQARKNVNLTQKEIAKKMKTTQSVISRIEHGYNISLHSLEKYASACGKHIEFNII